MKSLLLTPTPNGITVVMEEKPNGEEYGVMDYPVVVLTIYSNFGFCKLYNYYHQGSVMMMPEGVIYYR